MAEVKRRAANMTFTVPEDVKKRAQARKDVNWSAVIAEAIEERLSALELMDRLLEKAHLKEVDVDEFADAIDTAIAKRHGLIE